LLRSVGMLVIGATALFLPAGTLAWLNGWVYLVLGVGIAVFMAALARSSPGLMEERMSAASKAKTWDRWLVPLIGACLPLTLAIVAGLDRRKGWTTSVTAWESMLALAVMIASTVWTGWAMRANAYFSSHVRVQVDRGHEVVKSGPYAFVRHPGYAGSILFNLAMPILLGSLPALAVAAAFVPVFVLRTYLEDRTLAAELPGYTDYARRIRFRLVPLVW
jgi:protein-S-isoprenylcysteine O-methyltransferase Ste14